MDDEMRIGDAEREAAVRRLGQHYEDGRLTAEEHEERVEAALQAKTGGELGAVFADLPYGEEPRATEADGAGGRRGRSAWAARGPFGKVPARLLVALGVIAVLASVGCAVFGGAHPQAGAWDGGNAWGGGHGWGGHPHPPVLPILAVVAGVLIYRKRRRA